MLSRLGPPWAQGRIANYQLVEDEMLSSKQQRWLHEDAASSERNRHSRLHQPALQPGAASVHPSAAAFAQIPAIYRGSTISFRLLEDPSAVQRGRHFSEHNFTAASNSLAAPPRNERLQYNKFIQQIEDARRS